MEVFGQLDAAKLVRAAASEGKKIFVQVGVD